MVRPAAVDKTPIDFLPELNDAVRAFGLGQIRTSRYLAAGLMNRNWRIETDQGAFALKQVLDRPLPTARRNLAVLAALAAAGLPVHPPVPGVNGDLVVEVSGRGYYLFPWLGGAHTHGTDLSPVQIQELGILLGRLHLALNAPSLGLPEPEPAPSRIIAGDAARADIDGLLELIAERQYPNDFDTAAAEALRRRRALLGEHLHQQPREPSPHFPQGWVHGDFTSSNLLWDGGRAVGILDWDRIRVRQFGDEVARAAMLHFKSNQGHVDLDRLAAFVGAYRGIVPISADALADSVNRLWWQHLTSCWILEFHYHRADLACDYLLTPTENLLHWWTGHRDEVQAAFTAGV